MILPIGKGTAAAQLARELAHIGELHRGEALGVLDCQGRGLGEISRDVTSMSEQLSQNKKVLVVEMNLGQLRFILQGTFGMKLTGLNKVQGQPFRISEIEQKIEEMI